MTIVVKLEKQSPQSSRLSDYIASLESNELVVARGRSKSEAIGALIAAWPEKFGIEIKEDGAPKSERRR